MRFVIQLGEALLQGPPEEGKAWRPASSKGGANPAFPFTVTTSIKTSQLAIRGGEATWAAYAVPRKNVLRLTCGESSVGRSGRGGRFFFTARRVGEGAGVEGVVAEAMRELGDIECVVLEGGDMQAVAALRFGLLDVHVPFVVSWLQPRAPAEARDGFWEAFTETLARGSSAGATAGSTQHAAFSAACAWLENHGEAAQGGGGAAAAAAIPFQVFMMWCCSGGVPVTPNIRFPHWTRNPQIP